MLPQENKRRGEQGMYSSRDGEDDAKRDWGSHAKF
jgi:hypothetical protein